MKKDSRKWVLFGLQEGFLSFCGSFYYVFDRDKVKEVMSFSRKGEDAWSGACGDDGVSGHWGIIS